MNSDRQNILANYILHLYTTCLHYRGGTCPCKAMKDADGILIHVFVD